MAGSASEYIQHHLQNLTYGKLPAGYERADGTVLQEAQWTMAHNATEASDMGFMALHVDSLGWSVALGVIFLFGLFGKRQISAVGLRLPSKRFLKILFRLTSF